MMRPCVRLMTARGRCSHWSKRTKTRARTSQRYRTHCCPCSCRVTCGRDAAVRTSRWRSSARTSRNSRPSIGSLSSVMSIDTVHPSLRARPTPNAPTTASRCWAPGSSLPLIASIPTHPRLRLKTPSAVSWPRHPPRSSLTTAALIECLLTASRSRSRVLRAFVASKFA